jgi:hypothetical protein
MELNFGKKCRSFVASESVLRNVADAGRPRSDADRKRIAGVRETRALLPRTGRSGPLCRIAWEANA